MSKTTPPTYHLRDLGPETQALSRARKHPPMAMAPQDVAVGSMIVMTGYAANQVLKRAFNHRVLSPGTLEYLRLTGKLPTASGAKGRDPSRDGS